MWNQFPKKLVSFFHWNLLWQRAPDLASDRDGQKMDEARFDDDGGAQKPNVSESGSAGHRDAL